VTRPNGERSGAKNESEARVIGGGSNGVHSSYGDQRRVGGTIHHHREDHGPTDRRYTEDPSNRVEVLGNKGNPVGDRDHQTRHSRVAIGRMEGGPAGKRKDRCRSYFVSKLDRGKSAERSQRLIL